MRKTLASALLGLIVAGSALSPVQAAENDSYVSNEIVDASSLSNQSWTVDSAQSNSSEDSPV